jgi:hypothetical protein
MDVNTHTITRELIINYSNFDYQFVNSYLFQWESDFFAVSKSGYCYEIEVKISKSDFFNDFKKTFYFKGEKRLKHSLLSDENYKYRPNKFAFAVPSGLITLDDLPDKRYGLFYISESSLSRFTVVREPKFLHKEKLMDDYRFIRGMLDKFYWINRTLRYENNIRLEDQTLGQKRIYDRGF